MIKSDHNAISLSEIKADFYFHLIDISNNLSDNPEFIAQVVQVMSTNGDQVEVMDNKGNISTVHYTQLRHIPMSEEVLAQCNIKMFDVFSDYPNNTTFILKKEGGNYVLSGIAGTINIYNFTKLQNVYLHFNNKMKHLRMNDLMINN